MAWVAPTTSGRVGGGAVVDVQPTSGPVGSGVTVRDSSACGPEVLFGPAGAVTGGSALGYSHVVHYVIPSFVGDPGRPVTSGAFRIRRDLRRGDSVGHHQCRRRLPGHRRRRHRSVRGHGVDARRRRLLAGAARRGRPQLRQRRPLRVTARSGNRPVGAHHRHRRHTPTVAATGSWVPTAASSLSVTPSTTGLFPAWASLRSIPSWAWPPPMTVAAIGCPVPTAGSSPSATPPTVVRSRFRGTFPRSSKEHSSGPISRRVSPCIRRREATPRWTTG